MAVRSTYNNRLAPLAGLASFTGQPEETNLGNALSVAVYISDLSTLTIEQSPNKTNWYIMKQTTIEPNVRYIIQEPCTLAYFRITIHNEMLTAQAYCNLVTSLVQELTQGVDIRPLSSATDSVTVSNLPELQLVAGQNSNFNFYPTVDNNTIQIYADGAKGTNVTGGWQYTNTAVNKINWYIYQAPTSGGNPITAGQTVSSVKSMYAVINQQSTLGLAQAQNPWIMIYTIPDSNPNASFYKSKLFYGSNAHTDISGNKLLYTGTDPSGVHPEITGINRIKLDFNLSLSTKSEAEAANELVGAGTLQTTSNTPVGQFNFTMSQFGVDWEKVSRPIPIENGKVIVDTGVVTCLEKSPTGAITNLLGNAGDLVTGVHSTLQSLNLSKIGGGGFAYVKIYNKATAPSATDTAVFTIPIQNNSIQQVECHSLDFPLGIGLRATLNFDPADTDPPTGTVYGTAFYTNVI